MSSTSNRIRVLHVDDEPDFAEMAATFLERENDQFDIETVTSASTGLDRLAETDFDCIICDYDMPGWNGIEFLENVREEYPDLPFILYTGKGSEEVASDAISAGVTDYLQKESGTSQYEVLANRIKNSVEQVETRTAAKETEERLQTIAANTHDILWMFTADWNELLFVNSRYEDIWNRSIDELYEEPRSYLKGVHPEDREHVKQSMEQLSAGESVDIEYRVNVDENFGRWVWVQGEPVFDDDGTVASVVGFARDITERKEQERVLQKEQRFVFQALDSLNDTFFVVNQNFEFVRWNERIEEATGYSEAEIEEMNTLDLFPEHERDRITTSIETVIETGSDAVEAEILTVDGTRIPYEFRGSRLTDADGEIVGIVGIGRDLTERKEQETELRETRRRYEQMLAHNLDFLFIVDKNGDISYASPAVERITGHTPDEMIGTQAFAYVHQDDQDRAMAAFTDLLENPAQEITVEYRVVSKTGPPVWIEVRGGNYLDDSVIEGILVSAREITERKKRERELARQRALLKAQHESILDGILVVNENNEIVSYNERFVELWNVPKEVIEQGDEAMALEYATNQLVDSDEFHKNLQDLYENVEESSRDEIELTDGRIFDRYTTPLADDEGTYYGRLWTFRDITEHVEREADLKRQNKRLEEFVSIISHDLRNPLNVAQGRVQLAREEHESEHLDIAVRAHERAFALIDDLLTLAREGASASDIEPVGLANCLDQCWQNVETLETTLVSSTEHVIRADRSRLEQLLENLIRNAVEHGGNGVTVTMGDLENGFYIEDDGPGIPPEDRDSVFDAGFSTKADGTGFGLAIVKQVADAHDWSIRVTEGTDGGARFEITGVEFSEK